MNIDCTRIFIHFGLRRVEIDAQLRKKIFPRNSLNFAESFLPTIGLRLIYLHIEEEKPREEEELFSFHFQKRRCQKKKKKY